MEWQPIKTAPKDGTTILGFFPATDSIPVGRVIITNWRVNYGGYGLNPPHWSDGCVRGNPTHWMPLPEAPNAKLYDKLSSNPENPGKNDN